MLIITKQPYETVTNETNIMIKYFILFKIGWAHYIKRLPLRFK